MNHNLENCPVFIYNENGDYITKTIVTEAHKNERTISISGDITGIGRGEHLTIIIVHSNGISEYNGIAREVISGMREISLFRGRHKQRRANSRFKINTSAIIKSVTIDSNKITLAVPQNVYVIDISKSGTLINSSIKCFNVGTILEISLNTNDKDLLLYAQVKRELQNENGTFDYGCKLLRQHYSRLN